ncbi:MAG TPA: serine hydrolase [Vicinamibacteria bacterium]|nr:serine hydrolase [Vicinamibacteria bacterium]
MGVPLLSLLALGVPLALWSADPDPAQRVRGRLAGFRGVMGVAAKDLRTGEEILVDADRRFPTASVIKVAVMLEVFHRIAEGTLRADQEVALPEAAKVGGSGVLVRLHAGLRPTVMDLVDLMITVSDNTATNLLVELLGTAGIDARLAAYGLKETLLFRPTFRDGRPDVRPDLEKEFGLGMSTPREMARLLERIARGEAVSPAASAEMVRILGAQLYGDMIPRGLPAGVSVAHKTGMDEEKVAGPGGRLRHIRADVGIVEGPQGRFVLAIFARQVEDTGWSVDNEALVTGGEIARIVYDRFSR